MSRPALIPLSIALLCAAVAQTAIATACPPGYRGSYPKCMPAPAATHHPQLEEKAIGPHPEGETRRTGHGPIPVGRKIVDQRRVRPAPGGPIEHHAGGAATHAIIFVGGRNAINSQPVPPGHAPDTSSINSQPVPPGRPLKRVPNPGAPVEKAVGHRH